MEAFNIPINVSCIMYHNIKWMYTEMITDLIRLQFDVLHYKYRVYLYSYLDCLMQKTAIKMTEYMQTFLFERLSSFSNKRMFIDVCKTFFQYLLLHDKLGIENYQAFSLFQFVHCCYFVLQFNYHREVFLRVFISRLLNNDNISVIYL